jgi:hypothetical protein
MVSWQRVKPLAALGALGAAGLFWVLAFQSGWASGEWSTGFGDVDTRGKTIHIGSKDVETREERDKRLETVIKTKGLRDEVSDVKKSILGDRHRTLGDDIHAEHGPRPEGFEYNPREACLQMKMEYPERFGKVDCMSDRYDSKDPWWER